MAINPALQRRLKGNADPKGMQGILSRGANVYNGASNAAHSGGPIDYPPSRSPAGPPAYPPNGALQGGAPGMIGSKMPTPAQLQPRPPQSLQQQIPGYFSNQRLFGTPGQGAFPQQGQQGGPPQQGGPQGIFSQIAGSIPQAPQGAPEGIGQVLGKLQSMFQEAAARRMGMGGEQQGQSPAPVGSLPPPVGPQSKLAALRLAAAIAANRGQQ